MALFQPQLMGPVIIGSVLVGQGFVTYLGIMVLALKEHL